MERPRDRPIGDLKEADMRKAILGTVFMLALAPAVAMADDAAGKAVYEKNCKSCHGEDGTGNADKAKMLKIDAATMNLGRPEGASATKDDLKKLTTDGKAKMPAYGKKLKAEEIDAVVDYSMGLAKAIREKK
jgi:mono/diheme cytochrome c family protein